VFDITAPGNTAQPSVLSQYAMVQEQMQYSGPGQVPQRYSPDALALMDLGPNKAGQEVPANDVLPNDGPPAQVRRRLLGAAQRHSTHQKRRRLQSGEPVSSQQQPLRSKLRQGVGLDAEKQPERLIHRSALTLTPNATYGLKYLVLRPQFTSGCKVGTTGACSQAVS
jgi:hypothetical protein